MGHDFPLKFGSEIIKAKDNLLGNFTSFVNSQDREIIIAQMNPKSIAGEIDYQLHLAKKSNYLTALYINQNPDDKESLTFGAECKVADLQRAQKNVNQIRFNLKNPDISGVSQSEILESAGILAKCLAERGNYTEDGKDIFEQKEQKYDQLRKHLAAALGHKLSISELAKEKAEN